MLEGQIRPSAQELLDEIKSQLPQDVIQKSLESGRALNLDQVVSDLLRSTNQI
jgi:hypothetical protein